MRIFHRSVFAVFLCLAAGPVAAGNLREFAGTAVLLPSGALMVGGQDVTLWGIDPLANDQKCWHENRAWDCGEEAFVALQHHLSSHTVRCAVKSADDAGKTTAQCFRKVNEKEDDIARYLVKEGWARDRPADLGGLYAGDQDNARLHARGVWTSRFQSAEDWKNGVPRYVEYQPASPKAVTAQSSSVPAGAKNAAQ